MRGGTPAWHFPPHATRNFTSFSQKRKKKKNYLWKTEKEAKTKHDMRLGRKGAVAAHAHESTLAGNETLRLKFPTWPRHLQHLPPPPACCFSSAPLPPHIFASAASLISSQAFAPQGGFTCPSLLRLDRIQDGKLSTVPLLSLRGLHGLGTGWLFLTVLLEGVGEEERAGAHF